ncbi:MAG: hypothetical protein WD055_04515 [Candidatus Dependentiae bacterium]
MNIPTPETEQLQLFDNYGLWHVPFWQKLWFIILMILLASVFFVGAVFCLMKFMRSKKKKRSGWQQALYDLEQLKKNGLLSIAQSSSFYAKLTSILKQFVSYHYKKDVCSYTDQQMIVYVDTIDLFEEQKKKLEAIFSAGELIKFANQDALAQQMQDDWQFAFDFAKTHKELNEKKHKKDV